MLHVKSSGTPVKPRRDPNFKPPTTAKEFDKLTYAQRLQLHDEYPLTYKRFTVDRKAWEK
jgi:hypothetical protein